MAAEESGSALAKSMEGHAATALAVLLASVGCADTLTRRRVAARVASHDRSRQIVGDLLRMLNDSKCGGVVWKNSLSLLAHVVEADGASGAETSRADLVLSPPDQRVLIDVLLRQSDYVQLSSMGLWRCWLHAVHGIVVGSRSYSPRRHRRLDLLCALEALRRAGLHAIEERQVTSRPAPSPSKVSSQRSVWLTVRQLHSGCR